MPLKAIAPKAAEPSKPKILIFGKPGVGKTWASLDWPSVYYIDTEGGANRSHYTDKLSRSGGVYLGMDQGSLDFGTVVSQFQALATEKHSYKTVVIDSLTKLFNLEVTETAQRLEDKGKKNEFGADKKPAVAQMRRLLMWIQRLDMNVVLICHEKAKWGLNPAGERVETGVIFDAWEKLEYDLDLCLNILKQGPNRIARVLKTRLLEFEEATSFPWSFADFAKKYGEAVIAGEVKPLNLASPEQVTTLKELLENCPLPEGKFEKWLAAAQANSIEEIEASKIEGMINNLKTKLNTLINQKGDKK
jgi:hypothetical protein